MCMAQLGNCIARLHHITGVVRMASRLSKMSAKTKRIRIRMTRILNKISVILILFVFRILILKRIRIRMTRILDRIRTWSS